MLNMVSLIDTMDLGSKHKKILQQIFENPVRFDVIWLDIESFL